MKIGRLPLAIGLVAPLAATNPAPATGPTAGRGSSTEGPVLHPAPGATRWDGCEPVRLRRAIVVMRSGQGQAARDITSLQQVGEDYVRDEPPWAQWSADRRSVHLRGMTRGTARTRTLVQKSAKG